MFDHQAVFAFQGDDEDVVLEALMMADVDVSDIESLDGMITVFAPHTEFNHVKTALTEAFPDIVFEMDDISYEPQNLTELTGEDLEMFEALLDALNDCDDVQNVYHSVDN